MITKILAALVLGLGLTTGIQTIRVHGLKADIAEAREQHALALAAALERQAADLSRQILTERRAREARERDVAALTQRLRQMEDYHARFAPVLHIFVDGLLDRAREPGGLVPQGSGAPARTGTIASRTPASGTDQR